jgi:hypothetical protein
MARQKLKVAPMPELSEPEAPVWAIICELSDHSERREMAARLLSKRPWQADTERSGRLIQMIREIWRDPIAGPALRRLIRRSGGDPGIFEGELAQIGGRRPTPEALKMAVHSDDDPVHFLYALAHEHKRMRWTGEAEVAEPPRPGPRDDRVADYLADNVARAYCWLTREPSPPAGNFYQRPELLEGGYYRLGRAVFDRHGIDWRPRRLMRAASRAKPQK